MTVTTGSGGAPFGAAAPTAERRSRLRQLADLYYSPGDRTPASVGVAIGLLGGAGLVVLGPTSQLWLVACGGLFGYAVACLLRPVEAWRILRAAGRPVLPAAPDRATNVEASTYGRPTAPDSSGWLPTRHSLDR